MKRNQWTRNCWAFNALAEWFYDFFFHISQLVVCFLLPIDIPLSHTYQWWKMHTLTIISIKTNSEKDSHHRRVWHEFSDMIEKWNSCASIKCQSNYLSNDRTRCYNCYTCLLWVCGCTLYAVHMCVRACVRKAFGQINFSICLSLPFTFECLLLQVVRCCCLFPCRH